MGNGCISDGYERQQWEISVLAEAVGDVGDEAGDKLHKGLGFVCEDGDGDADAGRDVINAGERGQQEGMIGPEAARNGNQHTHRPHQHQENSVRRTQRGDLRHILKGEQDGVHHHPIAEPDHQGIQDEHHPAFHPEAGGESVTHPGDEFPDLGENATLAAEQPGKEDEEHTGKRQPQEHDEEDLLGGEAGHNVVVEIVAVLGAEQGDEDDDDDGSAQHVPAPVHHHRSDDLVIRCTLGPVLVAGRMPGDAHTAHQFAGARKYEIEQVADVDAVVDRAECRLRVDGQQLHLPAGGAEDEGQVAECHREHDPAPSARLEAVPEVLPIDPPEREIKKHAHQAERHDVLQDIFCRLFHRVQRYKDFSTSRYALRSK